MKEISQNRSIFRYRPLIVLLALWVVLVLRAFNSDVFRLVVSIASLTLLTYQWRTFRKNSVGLHLTFLNTMLVSFGVPCLWLALNVIRRKTYLAAADRPYSTGAWIYFHVVRVQDVIIWVGVVVFVLTCVFGVLDLARMAKTRKAVEPGHAR